MNYVNHTKSFFKYNFFPERYRLNCEDEQVLNVHFRIQPKRINQNEQAKKAINLIKR